MALVFFAVSLALAGALVVALDLVTLPFWVLAVVGFVVAAALRGLAAGLVLEAAFSFFAAAGFLALEAAVFFVVVVLESALALVEGFLAGVGFLAAAFLTAGFGRSKRRTHQLRSSHKRDEEKPKEKIDINNNVITNLLLGCGLGLCCQLDASRWACKKQR